MSTELEHKPFTDDGVTYCGWDGHDGCGEVWPCSTVRARTVSIDPDWPADVDRHAHAEQETAFEASDSAVEPRSQPVGTSGHHDQSQGLTEPLGDLHASLLAAITARRVRAEAATAGPWETPGPDTIAEWSVYSVPRGWMVASARVNSYPESQFPKLRGGVTGDEANRNAAHIAAESPDAALRHVARDLKVLQRHRPKDRHPGDCDWCRAASDAFPEVDWPCAEVLDLATAYGIDTDGGQA